MPRQQATPKYRLRKGYTQAIVTLTDSKSGKRRDYWLGEHGMPESREAYHRLIADWEARGRRWPDRMNSAPASSSVEPSSTDEVTVAKLIKTYWHFAKRYYGREESANFKSALRLLRQYHGTTPVTEFGPRKLRRLRDEMIRGDASADPPRIPWARTTINSHCRRIRQMFRWGVSHELVPPAVYQGLCALEPLKRGRTEASESEPVGPVAMELVEAVRPHVSRQVRALIDLQLLTGARPGELLRLRAIDIDASDPSGVWVFRPREHKNAHRGKDRTIHFGPAAQAILREFLSGRPLDGYLFSPKDAEAERLTKMHAERKTPLSCGNRPGKCRNPDAPRKIGDHYTVSSYRRAIQRGCDTAFPVPETIDATQAAAWVAEHRWHPHQLRHTAATQIRREFGLEAAQLVLGHSSAIVTDAVYAQRDLGKVSEVMRQIG